MAGGYEARPGRRQSFADPGVAPLQTSSGATAASRGAQLIGGESRGALGTEGITMPDEGAEAGLGAYFEKLMQPAIERKQQAQFFKGYTEAQSGRALSELTHNDSPLTKIFGPSGFAQGAQFYASQTAIDKWQAEQVADIDNLKRMAPEELSKHMAASSQGLMTGDPYVDQQVQAGVLQAQGPLIQTVAKARFAWMQQEAVRAQGEAAGAADDSLQQIAKANLALGEKADTEAIRGAATRFLGLMQKPEGMTDENYQKFLFNSMRHSMSKGNFYGVELLRARGVDNVLTEDQQRQIEDSYERYGHKAQDEIAAEPDVMERILRLMAQEEMAALPGASDASAADVVQGYRDLNAFIRTRSGVDRDYFPPSAQMSASRGMMGRLVARANALESRRQAVEDRDYSRRQAAQDKVDEAAAKIAAARVAWGTGDVNGYKANGGDMSSLETVAMSEFSQGNLAGITKAFFQSGFKADTVANQVQAMTASGLAEKHTKAADEAYKVWKQFHSANPAMARAYFGEYDTPWSVFDRLAPRVGSEAAYRSAFAKPGGYALENLPPEGRKEADKALESEIARHGSRWSNLWTGFHLTDTSRKVLKDAMADEFAKVTQYNGRAPDEAAADVYAGLINSGRFERYESIGWVNTRGGSPLGRVLGLQDRDAGAVIVAAIRHQLGRVGVNTLDGVIVNRIGNGLSLHYQKDGVSKIAAVSATYLQNVAAGYVKRTRRGAEAPISAAKPNTAMPAMR